MQQSGRSRREERSAGASTARARALGLCLSVSAVLTSCQPSDIQPSRAMVQRAATALVMGTNCRLIAVGPPEQVGTALKAGVKQLEAVDGAMSTYNVDSELSQFNSAAPGVDVPLSPPTLAVMRAAQHLSAATGGAFDVTMRPLGKVWDSAASSGRLPANEEIEAARRKAGADKVVLHEGSARKTAAGLEVSLDAIAKGYAIHQAIEAMRRVKLVGALVDVGGDVECFGKPLDADHWNVGVQSPWSDNDQLAVLRPIDSGGFSVCTSGNYRRFVTIDDRRYSHIIDPRNGQPTNAWPSVTVVAADAMTADGWATALSVLGPDDGLKLISSETGIEALFVTGAPDQPSVRFSPGLPQFVIQTALPLQAGGWVRTARDEP